MSTKWAQKQTGFTIVELLIVIVVIAILAAITIVAYNGIQDRARVSTIQTDLTNIKKKMYLYQVDKGQYPDSTVSLADADISVSKSVYDTTTNNNVYYCYNKATKEFAVGVRKIGTTTGYVISSVSNFQQTASMNAAIPCQAIGLSNYTDSDAFYALGFIPATGWQSWVK